MQHPFYAHSIEGQPPERWQLLEDHLNKVAKLSARFASLFGGESFAETAGKAHDSGKATFPWQAYLRHANQIVDELAPHYIGRVEACRARRPEAIRAVQTGRQAAGLLHRRAPWRAA